VSVEEAEASAQAAEVKEIKDDADRDLAVALPALEQAVKKVEGIDVNSFYELKGVAKPGPALVKMFEIVLNFFPGKGKPKKPTDDKTKEFDPLGYWTMAKKDLLSNPK
jgi:dynein heavy chain